MEDKVGIIILNWIGWKDTIECLESIFRIDYSNYQVIVVDNNSPNNSMEHIKAWAEGNQEVLTPEPLHPLYHLSHPPVQKPIPYIEYDRKSAEAGGLPEREKLLYDKLPKHIPHPMILIETGENLGFAGGNNVGIKYILAKGDFKFIWLLNNDTVVKKDSLFNLLKDTDSENYVLGCIVCRYHEPDIIQTVGGGKFNKFLLTSKDVFSNKSLYEIVPFLNNLLATVRVDYISGAALLVSLQYIQQVGLLDDRFFLYYEELDWQMRGRKYGFEPRIVPTSIIYHKGGASIGSSSNCFKKSPESEYFSNRSAIMFALKHYGFPGVIYIIMRFFAKLLYFAKCGKRSLIKSLFKSYIDSLSSSSRIKHGS